MIKVSRIISILKLLIQIKVSIVKRKEAKQGKGTIQYDFLIEELNLSSEIFSSSGISIEIKINMIIILLIFSLYSCNYNLNNRKICFFLLHFCFKIIYSIKL